MRKYYEKTRQFLIQFMRKNGPTELSKLPIKEYNKIAKKHRLLNTYSIAYITGLNWRDYKNMLCKEEKYTKMQYVMTKRRLKNE